MPDDWATYLARYHAENTGITERVLTAAVHHTLGTPYEWLGTAVPDPTGVVVDLACGSAPMHQVLSAASAYVGVDTSESELSLAKARGRSLLVRGDAARLPFSDASVDTLVCSMAVMLFRPIGLVLAEIARVLRPGGVFATIRPVGAPATVHDLRLAAPLLLGLRRRPELPQRFTSRRLRQLLAVSGLHVVSEDAERFVHPLETAQDAHLAVAALYLPHVSLERRLDAAERLERHARPGVELPLAIRRTVAVRQGAMAELSGLRHGSRSVACHPRRGP